VPPLCLLVPSVTPEQTVQLVAGMGRPGGTARYAISACAFFVPLLKAAPEQGRTENLPRSRSLRRAIVLVPSDHSIARGEGTPDS